MKVELGLLTRFMLKLNHWNIKNEKEKNHTSFRKSPLIDSFKNFVDLNFFDESYL